MVIKMISDEKFDNSYYLAMAESLCREKPQIFKNLLINTDAEINMTPTILKEAEEIFQVRFPEFHISFTEFLNKLKTAKLEEEAQTTSDVELRNDECGKNVYNPSTNKYTEFLPPYNKKRKIDKISFNTAEFLLKAKKNNEGIPLRWDDEIGDYIYNLYYDEEKDKKYLIADQSLRKVARIIQTLNEANQFRIMDLNPERIIK